MIIFLNGCSSSGKSSIARALQFVSEKPLLHLGIDTFFQMMPPDYLGYGEKANQGFHFITSVERGVTLTRIENGSLGAAMTDSIPPIVRLLADRGHDLVLDEVLITEGVLENYVQHLASHTVYFIGIFCALDELINREKIRGNRALGLSRDQFEKVHKGTRNYDLVLDTTSTSSFSCAQKILSFVEHTPDPVAFNSLREKGSLQKSVGERGQNPN